MPLCSVPEDSNHIFFVCPSVRFLWSCVPEMVGGSWCHANLSNMFAEVLTFTSIEQPSLWVLVGSLLWTLWNVRNKLVIEHIIPLHVTDAIYKLCAYLQLWRPLSKRQDRLSIDRMITALRSFASILALPLTLPLPPPPPEPI